MRENLRVQLVHDYIPRPPHVLDCPQLTQPIPAITPPEQNKQPLFSQQGTRENSQASLSQDEDEELHEERMEIAASNEPAPEKPDNGKDEDFDLFQKTSDEARVHYINKLINMKILNSAPRKKSQSLFVFDWDDTLFCTSFLGNMPFVRIPSDIRNMTQTLDMTVNDLLLKAVSVGDAVIITNSDHGWVEESSKKILPRTYSTIMKNNIRIISARNMYGNLFPNDMFRWKLEAFLSLKKQLDMNIITNIVVLGDSDIEMKAASTLSKQFKQSILKTIKFKESPKVGELIKELNAVINLFDEIFVGCKGMNVKFFKTTSH